MCVCVVFSYNASFSRLCHAEHTLLWINLLDVHVCQPLNEEREHFLSHLLAFYPWKGDRFEKKQKKNRDTKNMSWDLAEWKGRIFYI